jgi:hypothetical protein
MASFIPFSYDSKEGICSMFYLCENDQKLVDIIYDLEFTKLFNEFGEEGTFCYVQNIRLLQLYMKKIY